MQQARIYRAWLPSVVFSKCGHVIQREKTIVNRLRKATKRGKFSRAAWEFDVVLDSRQKEIPKQKIIQIYHSASIFSQFCAYLRQLSAMTARKENQSSNFRLIAVFVKVALEITKRAQHHVLPRLACFHVLRNYKVHKGHLNTEQVIKPSGNIQKVANLSA